jgi:hypothetical protein
MRSLEYLNQRSSVPVTFIDNRDADIIFSPPYPKSVDFIEDSQSFRVYVATNIVEIIQPQFVNLRYKITLNTANATITFPTLPAGVSVTNVGTSWIVTGIDSITDWNVLKSPTIDVDEDYYGDVGYTVTFTYNTTTELNVEKSYSVGVVVPAVFFESRFTLDVVPNVTKSTDVYLTSVTELRAEIELVIRATFFVNAYTNATFDYESDMSVVSTLTADVERYIDFADRLDVFGGSKIGLSLSGYDSSTLLVGSGTGASVLNASTGGLAGIAAHTDVTSVQIDYIPDNYGFGFPIWAYAVGYDGGARLYRQWSTNNPTPLITQAITDGGSGSVRLLTNTTNMYFVVGDPLYDLGPDPLEENAGRIIIYKADSPTGNTIQEEWNLQGIYAEQLGREGSFELTEDYVFVARNRNQGGESYQGIYLYDINDGTFIKKLDVIADKFKIHRNLLYTNTGKIWNIDTNTEVATISVSSYVSEISVCEEYIAYGNRIDQEVLVYQRLTQTLWKTFTNPFENTSGSSTDNYGGSVHITDSYCTVGSPLEDDTGSTNGTSDNSGALYIYS